MSYCDDFWHIDAHENILSPACLIVFVKIENWEPAYQICYCLLSGRQQRKVWNSCCDARPQTSLLQTYGLLTVLTLILWITGYVEYYSNVSIGNLLKTEPSMNWSGFWLKRGLASSKVSLIRQLTNSEFTLMHCAKAKGKHFENMLWCAVQQMSIICYETYIQLFFCFTTFNQLRLLKF